MKRSQTARVQIHFFIRLRAVLSFSFSFSVEFLFAYRGLLSWIPEMLFQIHAKLYERDTFTFEKSSLKQGVRPANEDFAAVADHTVPRNSFS